ncbi:MAG: SDR family NAD(P)-dependent oxidoreductase [Actinomycetota bacterium]
MATILVSESDSDIGENLAVGLALAGHQVIAASRSGALPYRPGNGLGIVPVELDLRDHRSIAAAFGEVGDLMSGLDVVVANGSVGRFGPLEFVDPEQLGELAAINLVGQMQMLRVAIPLLRRSSRARIIGISSISAMIGLPGGAASCAVRAGFEAALDALRIELLPFGVRVSVVQAAPATEAAYGLPLQSGAMVDGGYGPLIDAVNRFGCHVEPLEAVVDVVKDVLAEAAPRFRYTMGSYADLVGELRRADEDEAAAAICELFEVTGG